MSARRSYWRHANRSHLTLMMGSGVEIPLAAPIKSKSYDINSSAKARGALSRTTFWTTIEGFRCSNEKEFPARLTLNLATNNS